MIIVFDLDGTLCRTECDRYAEAVPIRERIDLVRRLREAGHQIIIETARGSGSGEDWRVTTLHQLTSWGLEVDQLRVGKKIPGDLYIDDRGIGADDFFRLAELGMIK